MTADELTALDKLMEPERPDIRTELSDLVKRYKEMIGDERTDFKNTPLAKKIMVNIDLLHKDKEPPIKLIEDILSLYKRRREALNASIVEVLQSYKLSSTKFDDGTEVMFNEKVNVKVHNKDALYKWLIDTRNGDALHHILTFKRKEYTPDIANAIREKGGTPKVTYGVAAQRRDKVIRDNLTLNEEEEKKGNPLWTKLPPKEAADVTFFNYVKIKE